MSTWCPTKVNPPQVIGAIKNKSQEEDTGKNQVRKKEVKKKRIWYASWLMKPLSSPSLHFVRQVQRDIVQECRIIKAGRK